MGCFGLLGSLLGYDDWYIDANLIAKQATSRQKQLDKLDVAEIKLSSRRDPSIAFKPHRSLGNEILEAKNVGKSYDDLEVFTDISFKVEGTDKIAIIGGNGVGKSTLLEIIMEKLPADNGYLLLLCGFFSPPSFFTFLLFLAPRLL